ncbi:DNA mismatch repair protein MutL [Halobacteriales archaeon QS_8_69_26]|nr:MAG: DNA mismatch repair protein MutL [Halobacteriales archaeon QS_8_69_26]
MNDAGDDPQGADGAGEDADAGGPAGSGTEIRPLDQSTVERIAAGEVVERPASVVKELVENAIDADASRIDVEIDGDGTGGIRVRDDGRGMTEADVRAAVREHTTSKIADIDDLESGVGTLGFRGEALHTIGAVSRLTITTKPRGADGAGTRLRYEGGEVVSVEPAGCPEGTTVDVEDLFYNTPARRKYLKREATEFAHVNRIVSRYALANPDVAVSLTHDDRETFATTGEGDLRAALLSVYGREVAEAMVPVVGGDPPDRSLGIDADPVDLPEGPLTGLGGYVSHPETTRSSREYVTAFVNGRYVDAAVVREAVLEAYGGQLASDRYPFTVLFLELPPGSVDVNVHPRKMEVRFGDEDGVRAAVRTAVRDALLDHGLVRTTAPRGRSAPDETPVDPAGSGADGTADDGGDGTGDVEDGTGDAGRMERADDHRPPAGDALDADPDPVRGRTGGGDPGGEPAGGRSRGGPSTEGSDRDAGSATDRPGSGGSGDPRPGTAPETGERPEGDGRSGEDDRPGSAGESTDRPDPARKFSGGTDQRTLSGGTATPEREYDRLPPLRVLGQLDDTYVVCETPDGIALVDQHAADERVNYERLSAAVEGETTAQRLATPVELELTPGEAATFEAAGEALSRLGFEAELVDSDSGPTDSGGDPTDSGGDPIDSENTGGTGGRTLRIAAVPAVLDATVDPDRLRDLLGEFVATGEVGETVEEVVDEFLADLACYPSVTGNTSLTEGSVLDLLDALDDCENPYACPHGRPVVVGIDRDEIAARFERDYPGHGGRRGE